MKIYTIGETTYDIQFREGRPHSSCSGGSAFNSAISLGRCALPVSLISTFGNDRIGDYSFEFLTKNGVDCNLIKRFNGQSRIALAWFDSSNNADYSFYQASEDVVPEYPLPQQNDIILLGSSFALRDNGRKNLTDFLKEAKNAGCIIIYDPNAREPVTGKPEIRSRILENISLATIIKGSDQDFLNIFGLNDGSRVYSRIAESGSRTLVYTKGAQGAELFVHGIHLTIDARQTEVISTIGAGDNFSAGIVYGLFDYTTNKNIATELTPPEWNKIMQYGILFASEVCGSTENYLSVETGKSLQVIK